MKRCRGPSGEPVKMDVPFLSKSEIENEAVRLLTEFNIGRGRRLVAPVPVEEVAEAALMTVVRVKGFKVFRDRHGRWRCYHRKTGTAIDLAKAPIGSPEFFAECARVSA